MIAPNQTNVRTIEIHPAQVYISGSLAGLIEVPIIVGKDSSISSELDELILDVSGEDQTLRPLGRSYFAGGLKLAYFSVSVRESKALPRRLSLYWRTPLQRQVGGMELRVQKAQIPKF